MERSKESEELQQKHKNYGQWEADGVEECPPELRKECLVVKMGHRSSRWPAIPGLTGLHGVCDLYVFFSPSPKLHMLAFQAPRLGSANEELGTIVSSPAFVTNKTPGSVYLRVKF